MHSKIFESDKKEDGNLKRSSKNVKYDLKTGQLMLDNFSPKEPIEEESPLMDKFKGEEEGNEDAKFEESKYESNQIVEKEYSSPGLIHQSLVLGKANPKI